MLLSRWVRQISDRLQRSRKHSRILSRRSLRREASVASTILRQTLESLEARILRSGSGLNTYFRNEPQISRNALASGSRVDRHSEPDASAFRLMEADRHTYLCPQTLFKCHPDFDDVLAGILKADAQAEIVLLEGRVEHWTNRPKQRFEKTLPGGTRRVRFLPALPRDEFLRLLAAADVILDPLHFGGGHTSYEALAVGTPVVTLPGEFRRSRITQTLYRKMGFTELIVSTPQQYIETAVRLGTDRAERDRVSAEILKSCAVLFEDPHEVVGLNDWLWSMTGSQGLLKSQISNLKFEI